MLGTTWLTRMPSRYHQRREPAHHDVDPVLYVHDVDVRIRARLEEDANRRLAGAGGVGDDVAHVLNAVDGLLQRNQNRIDQDVGTGAGISNGDRRRSAARRRGTARSEAS